jgi:hypothetical protein
MAAMQRRSPCWLAWAHPGLRPGHDVNLAHPGLRPGHDGNDFYEGLE